MVDHHAVTLKVKSLEGMHDGREKIYVILDGQLQETLMACFDTMWKDKIRK